MFFYCSEVCNFTQKTHHLGRVCTCLGSMIYLGPFGNVFLFLLKSAVVIYAHVYNNLCRIILYVYYYGHKDIIFNIFLQSNCLTKAKVPARKVGVQPCFFPFKGFLRYPSSLTTLFPFSYLRVSCILKDLTDGCAC